MAFEADCGSSTVLEALCVASTVRFLVPGECRAVMDVQARRLHHNRLLNLSRLCGAGVSPARGGQLNGSDTWRRVGGESEIRNSTRVGGGMYAAPTKIRWIQGTGGVFAAPTEVQPNPGRGGHALPAGSRVETQNS